MIEDSKKYKEALDLITHGKAAGIGKNRFYTVTGGENPFVIMTRSQRWYWKSQ